MIFQSLFDFCFAEFVFDDTSELIFSLCAKLASSSSSQSADQSVLSGTRLLQPQIDLLGKRIKGMVLEANESDSLDMKAVACLLIDLPLTHAAYKVAMLSIKAKLSNGTSQFVVSFWHCFETTIFSYLNRNLNILLSEKIDIEKLCQFSNGLNRVLENLKNVFTLDDSIPCTILWKMFTWIVTIDSEFRQATNEKCGSNLSSHSEIFACLSKFYHQQYILSKLIISKLILQKQITAEIESDQILKMIEHYCESSQTILNSSFPVGVVVEGSLTMVKLFYFKIQLQMIDLLQTSTYRTELSRRCLLLLVSHINDRFTQMQPQVSLALLSSFLLEAEKSLQILKFPLSIKQDGFSENRICYISALIEILIERWPCKTESQFVYFAAMLYLNWTKFLLAALRTTDRETIVDKTYRERIKRAVTCNINFAQMYWSFNSIEQIFESISNCVKIMFFLDIDDISSFHRFLKDELYECFYGSKNSLSIYRLFHLIEQSTESADFETVFKELIITKFTLRTSINHFLFYSNIPAFDLLLDDEDDSDDPKLLASYQISYRNIDLVRFLVLRFSLMTPAYQTQLNQELIELLTDDTAELMHKFLLTVLFPKILQMKIAIIQVHAMLSHFINSEHIFKLKAELVLHIVRLDRQYGFRLFEVKDGTEQQDESAFLQRFIKRIVVYHFDDQIRLQTLTLLVECRKSTAAIDESNLKFIRNLMLNCAHIQQAAARDQLSNVLRKLFVRLADGSRFHSKSNPQLTSSYCLFLRQLVCDAFDRLRPDIYFGAILNYLQWIDLFFTTFQCIPSSHSNNSPVCEYFQQQPIRANEDDFNRLLELVNHSFDEIKTLSSNLIILFHRFGLKVLSPELMSTINERLVRLLTFVQPQEVQTGVVLCRMMTSLEAESNNFQLKYLAINRLLIDLRERIQRIKNSPICGSKSSPSFPILSAIRTLICDDSLFDVQSCPVADKWKGIISNTVTECMAACEAVSPIVCNDSPEGHLPMDSSQIDHFLENDDEHDGQAAVKRLYLTSQMLLLNGWMTVKESVIILSHIAASFPDHNRPGNLVTCEIACAIIDFLYESQLSLVHRGAFEQTSYAFNRLISTLWKRSNCARCCNKFETIISQIGTYLCGDVDTCAKNNKFKHKTITRRSAGLPLVIQTILAAEPASPLTAADSLGNHFIGLLVCMLESEERKQPWQVVHSLNVLKTLVRDGRLSDQMSPWIERVIKIAVRWFDKSNYSQSLSESEARIFAYSIQNSSSMLFNALVTRVFGVKRNKADTSRKNRISSLLFFQNFPSLFSFLLKHVQSFSQQQTVVRDLSSAYPTLIILSRLTPSISENNIFDVSQFLAPLRAMAIRCRDIRLRTLAVRGFVQLLQTHDYQQQLQCLCLQLIQQVDSLVTGSQPNLPANSLHGTILLLSELVLQYSFHLEIECVQLDQTKSSSHQVNNPYGDSDLVVNTLNHLYDEVFVKVFTASASYRAKFSCYALQSLHLLNTRIFSLSMMTSSCGQKEYASRYNRHCDLLHKIMLDDAIKFDAADSIGSEELAVNRMMNSLVHCLTLDGDNSVARILQFVGLPRSPNCYEDQLLLWCLLNELLLIASHNDSNSIKKSILMKRPQRDTVFFRQINEVNCIVRRFHNVGLLQKSFMNKFASSDRFYAQLLESSAEWQSLLNSIHFDSVYLRRLANVQLEIMHEVLRLLFNARQLGIITDIEQFFSKHQIGSEKFNPLFLLDSFQHTNADENAYYSSLMLAAIWQHDRSKHFIDYDTYEAMISHLLRLSGNLSNLVARQAALQCLFICLPARAKQAYNYNFDNSHNPQREARILCQLFRLLFNLLQDDEQSIRYECSKGLHRLIDSIDGQVQLCFSMGVAAQSNVALSRAVATLVALLRSLDDKMAPIHFFELTIDIFLHFESEKSIECDKSAGYQEQPRLFDKSKLNTFSDGDLLVELLLIQYIDLLRNHSKLEITNLRFDDKQIWTFVIEQFPEYAIRAKLDVKQLEQFLAKLKRIFCTFS